MILEKLFLKKFDAAEYIVASKARIFLFYSFFMLLLLAMLAALYGAMPLSPVLRAKGYIGAAAITVLVLLSLALLRTGKLGLAVWSYAIPTIATTIALRIVNAKSAPETAFSTYVFYMPYLIVYVAVFGKRWHVALTTALFVSTNWLVWYMTGDVGGDIQSTVTTGIINSTMGLMTTGVLAYSLINIVDKYTARLVSEAEASAKKVDHIRGAMELAHDGLDVGATLVSESGAMEEAAAGIASGIEAIRSEVISLKDDAERSALSNQAIVGSTAALASATGRYRSMTLQASQAVEQMTASIGSVSEVSSRNGERVASLVSSVAMGKEKADESAHTIAALTESSKSLQDVIEVISAISSQTNLLAMNAAIEAAHAGESGKGFGVVADEIRRLAEETASNSRTISEGLRAFFDGIGEAEESNRRIDEAFDAIGAEIERTKAAFGEILSAMSEMSMGTKDINRSVSEVVEASAEMSESISEMDRMIRGNSGAVEAVRDKATKALSSLEAVEASFRGIVARSGNVRALGMRSDEVIRELDESIRAI